MFVIFEMKARPPGQFSEITSEKSNQIPPSYLLIMRAVDFREFALCEAHIAADGVIFDRKLVDENSLSHLPVEIEMETKTSF